MTTKTTTTVLTQVRKSVATWKLQGTYWAPGVSDGNSTYPPEPKVLGPTGYHDHRNTIEYGVYAVADKLLINRLPYKVVAYFAPGHGPNVGPEEWTTYTPSGRYNVWVERLDRLAPTEGARNIIRRHTEQLAAWLTKHYHRPDVTGLLDEARWDATQSYRDMAARLAAAVALWNKEADRIQEGETGQ